MEKQTCSPDHNNFSPETYDAYMQAQIHLPCGEELQLDTVLCLKWDNDGKAIGTYDNNLILDTQVYEVEFSDGEVLGYAANIIAVNLYSQVDTEGHQQVMLDDIINHKKDITEVRPDHGYVMVNGRKCCHITTKGWKLCVQ